MSARNFYQTFYQADALFRLTGESWVPSVQSGAFDGTAEPILLPIDTPDLLTDLDLLAGASAGTEVAAVQPDPEVDPLPAPALVITQPVPIGVAPELLPQPPPRPATPSILPPVQQQPRLPQLNHKVLLLADEELDPSNLLFLEKILKAVNLNINGVDLLNLHGAQDINFAELLRGKYINHFITFGVPFERIDLDIMMDRYAPVRFEGITFLMADSLPTIEADQALKKRLWGALQRVFLQR